MQQTNIQPDDRSPGAGQQAAALNLVEDYGWAGAADPHSCDYIAPHILGILARLKPARVLDLGSGNGALCAEIARLGCHVAGVEYDRAGVVLARREHPAINFHRYGVQDDPELLLAAEGEPFDVVVSTEVIEHLYAPHLLPRYAHRVLRANGKLVITTPYHGYLKNLALSLSNHWDAHHAPLWHGGHIKFWSRKTLTRLLHDNGFAVTGFGGVGRLPYLWKSMVLVSEKR
jgi:2-polyprenyl-3-methyl-5-hydroxy-6-metoxy-1,4-benzoquinol methylase